MPKKNLTFENSDDSSSHGIVLGRRSTFKDFFLKFFSYFIHFEIIKAIMKKNFLEFSYESTNICNANCSFCGYRFMKRKKTVLDEKIFYQSVDQFDKLGGGTLNFTPTVGDPLVDKHLVKKINYASKKKNIKTITSYTNGILLDKFGYKEVLNSGITRLAISTFIGSSEGYKKYYGKDEYFRVVNNIIQISKLNMELNYPVAITLHLRVNGNIDIWENSEDFKTINKYIKRSNITYLKVYDSWNGLVDHNDIPENCEIDKPLPIEVKKKSGPCFELYRTLHIMSDANVGPCVCRDMEGEINIGNVKESNLNEIWRGSKLKSFRDNWKNTIPKTCQNCTRYIPINNYIKSNKPFLAKKIIKKYIT
ncbi:SPASM domain-containing protein [Alphaproteobacteria bacterium]|nr:SPASM domain-containing protein [Alphaproteobacteria bacterium]